MSEAVVSRAGNVKTDITVDDESLRRTTIVALLVCIGYYFTTKIGFAFVLQPGSVSTLWMPNSILLAALLLVPARSWWVIILAAFPAHFAAELQSGVPTAMVLAWFLSNSVQALTGALCIHTFVKDRLRFDNLRDLSVFLFFGAFLAPFLASFLDVTLVKLNGWGHSSYWDLWRIRFLSNVLATLTLVPVIISWSTGGLRSTLHAPVRRFVEALILIVGLFGVGLLVFTRPHEFADVTPSLLYWPLPFLIWAAVRFGPRGTSTCLLVVMFLAISGATHGYGPFVANSSESNALSIQWFLIVAAIPLMSLAAVIADRSKTEKALRQIEGRLARTEAFSSVMVTHVGLDGSWLKVPPNLCELVGYSEKEMLSGKFKDITHPEDYEADWSQCLRLLKREIKSFDLEKRYIHKDGHIIWIFLDCSVVEDDNGNLVHFLTYIKDISDRKAAELAFQESNERNQAILRALPDIMFLQNNEGVYLDCYVRDANVLFVPREVFMGKHVSDILPPELAEKVMECIQMLDGSDEPRVLEYSLQLKDEERHFEARLISAGVDKVLTIVRDVTDSRRAADALRQSEEKLLQSNRHIHALAARVINAQESERRRISLQLHDDLSQNVAALGLVISRLKRKLPASREQIEAELEGLGQNTKELTSQIRRLSHQLHPAVLEHLGLVAALESHVSQFGREENIEVDFCATVKSEKIPFDVSVCLYRVALEALRNVSRHSGGTSARVSLTEDDDSLTLEVSDSGKSFDLEKAIRDGGLGLLSSRERISLLQGTFDVNSNPETGTTLVARVPITRWS